MSITATHISYYHICQRKLWLFSSGINMEHTSDVVAEGKLIHATTYPQRAAKYTEITIDGSKIDFYDAKNKVIHEIKKSDKMETAHEWQTKYYIWLMEQSGISGVKGIIAYPKLRTTHEVVLTDSDRQYLQQVVSDIIMLIQNVQCPSRIEKKFCRSCSYFDFCWINE